MRWLLLVLVGLSLPNAVRGQVVRSIEPDGETRSSLAVFVGEDTPLMHAGQILLVDGKNGIVSKQSSEQIEYVTKQLASTLSPHFSRPLRSASLSGRAE